MSALANQPAFPQFMVPDGQPTAIAQRIVESKGLTIRQYYAGLALQGLLANSFVFETGLQGTTNPAETLSRNIISASVEWADALIAKLEETK